MKKQRHQEEQIIRILREAECGEKCTCPEKVDTGGNMLRSRKRGRKMAVRKYDQGFKEEEVFHHWIHLKENG